MDVYVSVVYLMDVYDVYVSVVLFKWMCMLVLCHLNGCVC